MSTNEIPAKAYAAVAADKPLEFFEFNRRGLRPNDVLIDIKYCGVCHSDLHSAKNDWGRTNYPVVPGHEITGIVEAVGEDVTMHKVGDRVAVGCMVDACMECDHCHAHEENYCIEGMVGTYGGTDRIDGTKTYGGYSDKIVVRDEFALKVPDGLDLAAAAPALCAGITTYSPLENWNVKPGDKVAIAGIGGLGHMGVKFAVAMGAEVTLLTTNPEKAANPEHLGAHHGILTTDREQMKAARRSLDLIVDTIPVAHDVGPYLPLLKMDKALVIVGMIDMMPAMHSGYLLTERRILTGSGIGGLDQTQRMLNLCAEKNIVPDIEVIDIDYINTAYERLGKSDVKYRFVIDMESLKKAS